ncbi:hypothetical protein SEPL_016 [Salmonella phage SE_PL]|nr:hypothetical protein CPT_Munch_412 [Salmonella phage Munch]EAZ2022699.1 glycosyltransferase family 1 protein [Salmonella enterica]ECV9083833.1 glycosyltransferase family 1 protein [Salmonella enterica subsp. enterica serovar Infantis]MCP0435574.1 hypothetical protein [Salmonella enterica subsp. enterica serovar Mbandaka]QIG62629.1 hypothetical protein SEPL_016 [Salmonella phage SE_PL]
MTKAELIAQLEGYPDDAIMEVVQCGEHYDITCVVPYDDHGVPILELGIYKPKTVPESTKRTNNVN